jgi:hypothetical protein
MAKMDNDLQNTTLKTKNRETRTPLKTGMGVNSCGLKGLAIPAALVTTVVLMLSDTNIIWYENGVGNH